MARTAQVLGVWGALVLGGFGYLAHYSATAGVGDHGACFWPDEAAISRSGSSATLLVFLHPACPCSRATVEELARLLTQVRNGVDAVAVFVRPDGFAEGWERTELWERATRIPSVHCAIDPGGVEARRFGAATSGYTVLYDSEGRLVFRGGITGLRGHEGENAGESAVLSWLRGERAATAETPVFGCPLFDR